MALMPGQRFEAVSRPQDKGSTLYANPETPKPLKVTSAIQYPETLRGPPHQYETENPRAKLGDVPNPTVGRDPRLARAWLSVPGSLAACSSPSQGAVVCAKEVSPGLKLPPHLVHRTVHMKLPNVSLRGWLLPHSSTG